MPYLSKVEPCSDKRRRYWSVYSQFFKKPIWPNAIPILFFFFKDRGIPVTQLKKQFNKHRHIANLTTKYNFDSYRNGSTHSNNRVKKRASKVQVVAENNVKTNILTCRGSRKQTTWKMLKQVVLTDRQWEEPRDWSSRKKTWCLWLINIYLGIKDFWLDTWYAVVQLWALRFDANYRRIHLLNNRKSTHSNPTAKGRSSKKCVRKLPPHINNTRFRPSSVLFIMGWNRVATSLGYTARGIQTRTENVWYFSCTVDTRKYN